MLDRRGFRGKNVETFACRQGAPDNDGIALVGHPATIGVEVRGVVSALVECDD